MIQQLFGDYLVKSGRLSEAQLQTVYESLQKVRVKLGLIAVSEKLLTPQQADEVNRLQAVVDKRFGDIAVEKGYLTEAQVVRLLGLQGNAYLTFIQAIADNGFMYLEEIESSLAEFQKENAFTASDVEALKSDDTDRIVELFLPEGCDELQAEHMKGAIRAIIRLIDSNIYVEKAIVKSTRSMSSYAQQNLKGSREASLMFAGDGDALLAIAEPFAGEEFESVDLDALDAVGEFINCVNGMFCTKVAAQCELDMLPPSYREGEYMAKANRLCIMPVHINNVVVNLITSFDEYIVV